MAVLKLNNVTTLTESGGAITLTPNTTASGNLTVTGTSTLTGNATASGNLTVTGDIIPSTPLSHRNMIINGAMNVSQRATTTAPTPKGANDDGYFLTDRWALRCGGTTPARLNLIQESITDLAGFGKAMKIDCTTASASPGSDDFVKITQKIEGLNLQQMEKGYSSAKACTLSFWIKGTASRTYVAELLDSPNDRAVCQQFSVTTSWVRHEITFPGDTDTGSKIDNDNSSGLQLNFHFHAGSNYTSGTYVANTWRADTDANRAVGISNSGAGAMYTTSDEVWITGVQLELGSSATPFEHRSYGDELARCLRYYIDSRALASFAGASDINDKYYFPCMRYHPYSKSSNYWSWATCNFPVPLRAIPSNKGVYDTAGTDGKIMYWTNQGGGNNNNHSPHTVEAGTLNFTATVYADTNYGFGCNYWVDAEL